MSLCVPSEMSMASRRPSGENDGLLQFAGIVRSGDVLPVWSTHWIGVSPDVLSPPRYATVPVRDTVNCPEPFPAFWVTASITGTPAPATAPRDESNGTENSALLTRYRMWPLAAYRPKVAPRSMRRTVPSGSRTDI